MRFAIKRRTLRAMAFGLPLFIMGCDDDDFEGVVGIVLAVTDLVLSIISLVD